ncbi:MAG: hypothetical protein V1495_01660 [Pseudomonadota bacterium]
MPSKRKLIGQVFLERKHITAEQLEAALARQERWGKRIGENLVALGYITEKQLAKVLGEVYRLPTIDIETAPITSTAIRLIPGEFCRKHHLVPITLKSVDGKNHLILAVSDPSNIQATDELRFMVKHPIFEVLSTITGIDAAIRKYYHDQGGIYTEDRPEVTLSAEKGDGSMEVVHGGVVDRVKVTTLERLPVPPSDAGTMERAFHALVEILVNKGILTEEQGRRLLSI